MIRADHLFEHNLQIKNPTMCTKEFLNVRVNRARKAYQWKVFTPIKLLIATSFHLPTSRKQGKSMCFLHCASVRAHLQNSENQPRHLFDHLNLFHLPPTRRALIFNDNWKRS